MKLFAIASFVAFCVINASAEEIISPFVVNGVDASIEDHPYMAKVWNLNWPACGGSILTQRSVLTVRKNNLNFCNQIT
jgi:hypothetical protein